MAEFSTVARPYAEALFAAVRDDKASGPAVWLNLVNEMAQIATNSDVREAMSDPRLEGSKRADLFTSLIKSAFPETARNFIKLLVENDRILLLPEIAEQFDVLKNQSESAAKVVITSAFALSDEQVKDLVSALELKFGLKLKPQIAVDKSLIGGVRVVVGDQVLDTSVQAQLVRMRETLAA